MVIVPPAVLPMVVLAVPVLLIKVVPVRVNPPPKVDSPEPTLKVLVPVIEVAPLREIAPVPVPKVPEPDIAKLPEV